MSRGYRKGELKFTKNAEDLHKKSEAWWNENPPTGDPPELLYCWDEFGTSPMFWLPHSCDEWVIGDLNDAKQLLADLQEAIAQCE